MSSLAISLLAAMLGAAAPSARMSVEEVPAPLRPWIGWATRDKPEALCPYLDDSSERSANSLAQRCVWPARLVLSLDDKGGRFTQSWHLDAPAWVPLPGSARFWPQQLTVDGAQASAFPLATSRAPGLRLERGDHVVAGEFQWDSLPESVPVPSESGLVALSLRGTAVDSPQREADGTLWLQRRAEATTTEGDRLALAVHRMVSDEVPLQLVTRIELRVSGKSREEVLGPILPAGLVPFSLETPLPVRLESDTRLRVQVRPGTYVITVKARSERRVEELVRPVARGAWGDEEELWVFDHRPALRQVSVEGAEPVDPQLTSLPDDWKRLPVYSMPPGATMNLVEHRRGDSAPPPDQLALRRELWMDFEGRGYTVRDTISGEVSRSWRMEMAAPWTPGRVSVDGSDVLITRGESGRAGVELRSRQLALSADSRIEGAIDDLPATGWAGEFRSVSAIIHLPPGWRLLHATGVDEVTPTWFGAFTLLGLLLVVAVALASWRLLGLAWGLVALGALGLTVTEPDAPCWAWLLVLGAEGLSRVAPQGWPWRSARVARWVLTGLLCLWVASFVAGDLQAGLFPTVVKESADRIALAIPGAGVVTLVLILACGAALGVWLVATKRLAGATAVMGLLVAIAAIATITFFGQNLRALFASSANALGGDEFNANASSGSGARAQRKAIRNFASQADPSAAVQTGPGIPTWEHYNTTEHLSFTGPIEAGQRVHLYLLGPIANLGFTCLRCGLLALFILALLRFPGRFWPGRLRASVPALVAALIVASAAVLVPGRASAQVPPSEVLTELGDRLTAPPDCAPRCAASPRLLLEVGPAAFTARMEIAAAAATAVPLPGAAPDVVPSEVLLDGLPATSLARDGEGHLLLAVGPGRHQVLVSGRLPARDSLPIALPLLPHRVEAKVSGWRLDGLHEDGAADDTLLLTRLGGEHVAPMALQATALPPFLSVERTLILGLRWQVSTQVVRASPPGMPAVLEVPLLPGESVTTAGIRVVAGKAQVSLGPSDSTVTWESSLEPRNELRLVASPAAMFTEVWRLEAGPIWHVVLGGIPPTRSFGDDNSRRPEWHPWPGEEATLTITRPEGVPGQILTVDHSVLELWPGAHSTEARLEVSLRSSRSGEHALILPPDAALSEVSFNGAPQAVRRQGSQVIVPIERGAQTLSLVWHQGGAVEALSRGPQVDLGIPGVNSDVAFHVPAERWVLAAGGPGLGPSIQIWIVLVALLLASLALGQVRSIPLRWWHWLLLGAGCLQMGWYVSVTVAGALLLLGWRASRPDIHPAGFKLRQAAIVALAAVGLLLLAEDVIARLSGQPSLGIAGNGSSSVLLRWTVDRTGSLMPRPWMISLPLWAWRATWIAWALWLAIALLKWGRWGWRTFLDGGAWRLRKEAKVESEAPAAVGKVG